MPMNNINHYIAQLKPTFAGKFLYYCLPFRKKVVLENMQHVFSETLNADEITKLAKAFYSHMATSLKENILMRFMSEAKIKACAEVIGYEKALAASKQNKGIIIVTGHFGNWEFSPIAGILNFAEFQGRFHFVRKTLEAKWIEKILFRRYLKAGLRVIQKKNALNKVCDALERNDAVVFVMDQHACVDSKDGILVEFFGKKAGTYRSVASIIRYTGVPVLPLVSYRKPDGTHVLEFSDPIPWIEAKSSHEELYLNTLAYNQALEGFVLKHPEQWLWMHRRWKYG